MMVDASPDNTDNDMDGLDTLIGIFGDNAVMEESQQVHNEDNLDNNAEEEISTEHTSPKTYCYSGPDLDTDDEEDDEQPLLQANAKPAKLHELLNLVTCSRDIDSIAVLAPSISQILKVMEPSCIIKISRMVQDRPTTSSRYSVQQRIQRNGKTSLKHIPLHDHQNITLGTVIANNIRFHLNIYSLKYEGPSKTPGYRPFTEIKRLVIVAALNLARMLQCNRARRLLKAWSTTALDKSKKVTVSDILSTRMGNNALKPKHAQHWVSGGEVFFMKNDAMKASELSCVQKEALPFLIDFETSLKLISHGILNSEEIWKWSFSHSDLSHTCTKGAMMTTATDLVQYKLFGLTAAGTKHDFERYEPFSVQKDIDEDAVTQFNTWLEEAGKQNKKNAMGCFITDTSLFDDGIFATLDDGLTIHALHQRLMLVPLGKKKINIINKGSDRNEESVEGDEENVEGDEENVEGDEENVEGDEESVEGDEESAEWSVEGDEESVEGDEESVDGDEENIDKGEHVVGDDNNDSELIEGNDDDDVDIDDVEKNAFDLFGKICCPPSSVRNYPALLNTPLATTHTGKVRCKIVHCTSNGQVKHLSLAGKSAGDDVTNYENGLTAGFQIYLTAAKNTKGASFLKNVSKLGHIEKASYGLMQPSLRDHDQKYRKLMDTMLNELDHFDFSDSSTSELLSRNFCYRVECFRMLTTVDTTDTNIHMFPIDILNVPMLVATKDKLLKNYYRTLRFAKDVVTRVFCPGLKQDAMDPRQLSPSAKMAVQYLSEIIAYDIGTPSGYSRMGPIMASIMNQDYMKGIGISFPVNGSMLQQHEKDKTCLSHGLDPSFWSLSQSQSIEEQIRLAMGLTSEGHDGTTTKLDVALIEKTRKFLSTRLFRFQKRNKDKDLCSWQLFVSEFITVTVCKGSFQNAFDAINYNEFASLANKSDCKELDRVLDGLASVFWVCYDWEWRSDMLKSRDFMNPEAPHSQTWPNTVDSINNIFENHSCVKKGLKSIEIDTPEKLRFELFQGYNHYPNGLQTKNTKQGANWISCIYLQLYWHIQRHLRQAREKLYESTSGEGEGVQQYKLAETYFLCKLALSRCYSCTHGDHPIVWGTTRSNRKKNLGRYIIINKIMLIRSTDALMRTEAERCLSSLALARGIRNGNATTPSSKLNDIVKMDHKDLHNSLMQIPYNLSSMLRTDTNESPGKFISVAHVLVMAILSKGVGSDNGDSLLNNIMAVKPEILFEKLCHHDDPLSYRSTQQADYNLKDVCRTNVHLLWDSKESFCQSVTKVKSAVRSKVNAEIIQLPTSSFVAELMSVVESFDFSSKNATLPSMINIEHGKFNGINEGIVCNIKILCLCINALNLKFRAIDKKKDKKWKEAWKICRAKVALNCHQPKYWNVWKNGGIDNTCHGEPNRRQTKKRKH